MGLKIGVVGPTFPPVEGIAKTAQRLEEKGYDSIWFPDHLMGWFPQTIWTHDFVGKLANYSPHTFFEVTLSIAVAGMATKKIRIGSAVTEPIRHHPAVLAQSYATLEHITKGRVIFGIGAGELENIRPYGLKYEKVVSRLEEALKVIRLLWSSERDELVNFDGEIFKLEGAVFEVPPYSSRPPIWVGGAGERMCRITARYADGWIPFGLGVEEFKEKLGIIENECRKIGRDFRDIEIGAYLNLVIDRSRDECEKILEKPLIKVFTLVAPSSLYEKYGYEHPLGKGFYPLTDYIPAAYSKSEILKAIEKVPVEVVQEHFIWGSVDDVIDKLEEYRKEGLQTVIFWNHTLFGDISKVKSSYNCIDEIVQYYSE